MTRALLYYGGHAILCALLLAWLVPFGEWPLRIPFSYSGDGLIFSALVKAIAEDGPLHAHRIGAPFGSDLVDWPLGMWLPLSVTTSLVALCGDAGIAINVYWLLSLVLAGVAATWTLVRLSLPRSLAFVFGMLYAFLPYGFYRNVDHVNTLFPLVPLVALLGLRVAGTHPGRIDRAERRILLGACLAQGLSYVYYAFFGCGLLIAGATVGWLRTRQARLVRLAGAGVLFLSLGSAIPWVPSLVYWARHGPNPALAYKSASHADLYGLKIRHLLVPRADHPVGVLREVARQTGEARFPGENENKSAALGLVGSLGFLALVGLALGSVAGGFGRFDEDLGPAAALTMSAVLVAQVGGLGSLFNVLVSPQIRAYNRIAVFIGFFSLYATAILMQRAWARLPGALRERRRVWGAALLLLLGLGIADQIPLGALSTTRQTSASTFEEVDAFVARIERRLPAGSMVFQLPHQSIPIPRRLRRGTDLYAPGRAYLSSRSLRWSWGSMIGRSGDWQMLVAGLPPASMARTLALAGFSGVWIDRLGFTHEGQASRLEAALAEVASSPRELSAGGRYAFVELERYRRLLETALDPATLARERSLALTPPYRLRWREGCTEERFVDDASWRSCRSPSTAVVRNPGDRPVRLRITGRVRTEGPGRVTIRAGNSSQVLAVNADPVAYRQDVAVGPRGMLPIELSFDGVCRDEADSRCVDVVDFVAHPVPGDLQGAGDS